MTVFAYGEVKGNPGPASINVHAIDTSDTVILQYSESIGNANANYADYYAVMSAMQTIRETFAEDVTKSTYEFKLSNQKIVKQLNAELEINDPGAVALFIEIHNMRISTFPNIIFTHVQSELAAGDS